MRPGGQLIVRGGTYAERIKNPSIVAGTSDAPVIVAAAPGERPVVSGLLWLKGASYWTIDGINVTWSDANLASEHMVKMTDGVGWRYTASEIWGAHSYAGLLIAGTPSNWTVDHLYVHDTYATNGTNQDHLIYVNAGLGSGRVAWNVLANSSNGRAIKVGPPSATSGVAGNVLIDHNTMFNNLGPSNVQLAWGTSDVTITLNIMDRSGANRNSVTAYQLSGTGNLVTDNVYWDSAGASDVVPGVTVGPNLHADPMFADVAGGDYHATNDLVLNYGAYAPGR